MNEVFFAVTIVALILGVSELLWRKHIIHGEYARKLVHILVGCFVATMPFWISYNWIIVFGAGAIGLSAINHFHRFFKAGLGVMRKSFGDLLLAAAMVICAAIHPEPWIFMAAILHVSLADGFAAVVGTFVKSRNNKSYSVLGYKKTIAGTLTVIIISFAITFITLQYSGLYMNVSWLAFVLIPVAAALTENMGAYGADNLLLPLVITASLTFLKG